MHKIEIWIQSYLSKSANGSLSTELGDSIFTLLVGSSFIAFAKLVDFTFLLDDSEIINQMRLIK